MGHQSRGQENLWIWRRAALLRGHFNTVADSKQCAGVVAVECSKYQVINTPGEKNNHYVQQTQQVRALSTLKSLHDICSCTEFLVSKCFSDMQE